MLCLLWICSLKKTNRLFTLECMSAFIYNANYFGMMKIRNHNIECQKFANFQYRIVNLHSKKRRKIKNTHYFSLFPTISLSKYSDEHQQCEQSNNGGYIVVKNSCVILFRTPSMYIVKCCFHFIEFIYNERGCTIFVVSFLRRVIKSEYIFVDCDNHEL